jgi:hypothetical protein
MSEPWHLGGIFALAATDDLDQVGYKVFNLKQTNQQLPTNWPGWGLVGCKVQATKAAERGGRTKNWKKGIVGGVAGSKYSIVHR